MKPGNFKFGDDAKTRVASSSDAFGVWDDSSWDPHFTPKYSEYCTEHDNASMSTGSTTDEGLRFKPLPPTKKQRLFPTGRRSVKPPSSIPEMNKRQSSLTQMEWSTTPRHNYDISSGDDEDEEYQPPAKRQKQSSSSSAKKRKKKLEEREKGQDTYTQFMRRPKTPGAWRLDDEGFQVWQDADEDMATGDREGIGLAADFPTPNGPREIDESENREPEIAESSQNVFSDHLDEVRRPTPRKSVTIQRTPQKVRCLEVPSSQTPPSTKRSTQRRVRAISRSPLKERSANSSSPVKKMPSPESQMSMKMLERTRLADRQAQRSKRTTAPVGIQLDEDLEQCVAEAADEFSLRTYQMPPPPKTLQRSTTIQDSQAEDLDTLNEKVASAASPERPAYSTVPDSQRNSSNESLLEDSRLLPAPRRLRRVATVQDSQLEDDDFDFEEGAMSAENRSGRITTYDDNHEGNEHCPEGTFDPAFSALDRDAGRFTWTQTQRQMPEIVENSETEDEDLNVGSPANTRRDAAVVSDRTSQELGDPLPPAGASSNEHVTVEGRDLGRVKKVNLEQMPHHDDSAYESGDQVAAAQGVEVPSSPPALPSSHLRTEATAEEPEHEGVPSSPPPLRVSQVSTVVPTQCSIPAAPASPEKRIKAEPLSIQQSPHAHEQGTQTFSLVSSPQRPRSHWQPESWDSSPLPLPPWSSPKGPGVDRRKDDSNQNSGLGSEPQMDSLADFSLPPPPPLSSSRRQTPSSSSL